MSSSASYVIGHNTNSQDRESKPNLNRKNRSRQCHSCESWNPETRTSAGGIPKLVLGMIDCQYSNHPQMNLGVPPDADSYCFKQAIELLMCGRMSRPSWGGLSFSKPTASGGLPTGINRAHSDKRIKQACLCPRGVTDNAPASGAGNTGSIPVGGKALVCGEGW